MLSKKLNAAIAFFLFLFISKSASALPFLPFDLLLKPYLGANTIVAGKLYQSGGGDLSGPFFNRFIKNYDIFGGIRIHENFGFHVGYLSVDSIQTSNQDSSFYSYYGSLDAYYPFFDVLGTALEVYSSISIHNMSFYQKNTSGMIERSSGIMQPGIELGLQTRIFGVIAANAGIQYILPGITTAKIGLSIYFL